ncbi:hypothetical protein [Actinomadura terrae]|uniref:hypothetical protein n=1 Tax=Actinomadura terrae TaxID=604353 RepID=UPI001FA7F6E5|nr:hypothetical protein [Actinomadura terrae]
MQSGLHCTPPRAGLANIPLAVGTIVGFAVVRPLRRLGRTVIHGGTVVAIAGVTGVIATLPLAGQGVSPWQLAPALLVTGLGMGLVMALCFATVLAGVEPHESGSAGGTLGAVQELGSALGVAAFGTIFFGRLPDAGFDHAMAVTLWVVAAMAAVCFAATFLLPRPARA